jgi:hypothetical protein
LKSTKIHRQSTKKEEYAALIWHIKRTLDRNNGSMARGKPLGAWKSTWQKYLEVWRAASRMAHGRTRGRNIWKSGARQAAWRMEEHVAEIYGSLARVKPRDA